MTLGSSRLTLRSIVRRSRGLLLAAFLVPLANCNCANVAYERAHHGALVRECDGYRYAGPAASLRAELAEFLEAQGYTLDGATASDQVTTRWLQEEESRRRLIVQMTADAQGIGVRVTAAEQHRSPPRYESDGVVPAPDLEAAVVRRLVPSIAREADAALLGHAFDVPARIVMDEAAAELQDRGELVMGRIEDDPLQTQWRDSLDGATRTRYRVSVVSSDHAHVRLQATLERAHAVEGSRQWVSGASKRDLRTELALVDFHDPVAAAEIRSNAKEAGRAAYQQAIDSGAPSCGI